jgi:membrane-associated protease RseP (regulator of RpoE activity)
LHAVLFILTVLTTTYAGAGHYASFISDFDRRTVTFDWTLLLRGFWYSGTLLAILGAHEMGHYLLCRRYNIDATPPFFIPMPIFWTGTLGAVIKIREAFPTRRILFDIGVAGPIAGFLVVVPALFWGMSLSELARAPTQGTGYSLGEPLLFKWAVRAIFGTIPEGQTVNMHPMVFAAWFGMLATYWNLLPFGQFDGGHLTYATLGRFSKWISLVTVTGAIAMTFVSLSWLVMTVMMVLMLRAFGPSHPPALNEYEALPRNRYAIAFLAAVIFVLCFMPVPLEPYDFGSHP